jgi:hypothetical protein
MLSGPREPPVFTQKGGTPDAATAGPAGDASISIDKQATIAAADM